MPLVWLLKVSVCHWCGYLRCRYAIGVLLGYAIGVVTEGVGMPLVWLLKVSVCHWCGYLRCRYAIGVVT